MARTSERFRCPHCRTVLVKSGFAQLIGQSGGFMGVGTNPVTCPACRGDIDPQKLLSGEHDVREAPGWVTLLLLAWMFGGPVLLYTRFKWPLLWALLTPWGSLLVVGFLFAGLGKLRGR